MSVSKIALAMVLAACVVAGAACAHTDDPSKIADQVMRAVYDNDMQGVTANFDSALAGQVTRASLGALSDKLHSLGQYQGLTETQINVPRREYTFDAAFDKGHATVAMRLDADGKVAAYRVLVGQ